MNANCDHHKEAEKPHSFLRSCLQYELTPGRRASQLPTSQSECIGNTIIQISTPDLSVSEFHVLFKDLEPLLSNSYLTYLVNMTLLFLF